MNKIFGFFKQKIVEAKQQNKQELQAIVGAFSQVEPYSKEKTLLLLEKMKGNYIKWSILIANQASTGLYYSQIHNRNVASRKITSNKETAASVAKNQVTLSQMMKTHEELKEISDLSLNWVKDLNQSIDDLSARFAKNSVEKVEVEPQKMETKVAKEDTAVEETHGEEVQHGAESSSSSKQEPTINEA